VRKDGGKNSPEQAGSAILEGAYALKTPQDNRAYYQRIATDYDADFAAGLGYIYPVAVADAFLAMMPAPQGRICDIGCGTGLVAAHLVARCPDIGIDGVDISPEMLKKAAAKTLYKDLYEIDLTSDLAALPMGYCGMISAGTFTHGHLGPAPLRALMAHCQAGAVFCIGVNQHHYDSYGFAPFLDNLVAENIITPPDLLETKIYSGAAADHGDDLALICRFCLKG